MSTNSDGETMAKSRSRRGTTAMIVGVILVLAGALVVGAAQTAFAAKSVRITNFASGNTFAISDEQMLSKMPFADSVMSGTEGIRQRIFKRRAGTVLGVALCCAGLVVGALGLRRRRGVGAPGETGAASSTGSQ